MVANGIFIIQSSPLMQCTWRNPHLYKTFCTTYNRNV